MKKIITVVSVLTFLFSIDASAQTQKQKKNTTQISVSSCCSSKKAEDNKTSSCSSVSVKTCSSSKSTTDAETKTVSTDKKSCGTEVKGSCCSSKKVEAKKED